MSDRKQVATRLGPEGSISHTIIRFGRFAVCVGLLGATAAAAAEFDNRQVVQDVMINIGILPATDAGAAFGSEMHRDAPQWGDQYHVSVALSDRRGGSRITAANVRATVTNARVPGKRVSGPQKRLEPMLIAGKPGYGNYINMPAPGPYRVVLEVRRPGVPDVVKATFDYRHGIVAAKRAGKETTLGSKTQSTDRSR